MRAWELNEVINLTSRIKLWVNPEKKQIVEVPADKHHTQYAYEHPEKFGLSGNLFKDYDYETDTRGLIVYDEFVSSTMFKNGWVRVNVENPTTVSVHSDSLKQCALALRILKQKYNDIDTAIVDIGLEFPEESYKLRNNEYGKGPLRIFMQTGKITDERFLHESYDNMNKTFIFKDGKFKFYTAHYGSWANDKRIVFRVRTDANPKHRAKEKDIKYYDRILKSSDHEIDAWLKDHPDRTLISIEE